MISNLHKPAPEWRFADSFTLEQIVSLWFEVDPGVGRYRLDETIQRRMKALEHALTVAVCDVALPAKISDGMRDLRIVGSAIITREDIRDFAKGYGESPPFFCNALLPQLGKEEPEAAETKLEGPSVPSKLLTGYKTNKSGKRRDHDWDGALFQLIKIAELGVLPEVQAELVVKIDGWFSETYIGGGPGTDEIKKWVSLIYKGMKRGGKFK